MSEAETENDEAQVSITLEVCVGSLEGALVAEQAGADRIELNVALELDGLSPSPGLLQLVSQAVRIPVITMARPRAGNFVYSESEWETLLADAKWQIDHGASGIAFGCLTPSGQVDARRCEQMRSLAGSRELVFHKAFDDVTNWALGLDILIKSGINRVMTSGQNPTALEGVSVISAIKDHSSGRIEILPAGRIGAENATEILTKTGCNQLHGSFSSGSDGNVAKEIRHTRDVIKSRFEHLG